MLPVRMLGLLINMLLLSDVVSPCPADYNPLILDPPDVIVRYGEQLFVNCSSKIEDFEIMYWSNEANQSHTDISPSISWSLFASVWNVNASCMIKLNDSVQCRKELKITVYKSPDKVVLHPLNAMVEGRQHELHCDIINVAPVQNLTVRWYMNDAIIMTESFNKTTKTPVNESSTLLVNISRGDSGVLFRCEAQLDFDSNTIVTSDSLNVSVHYVPELNNKTDDFLDVEEGSDVTLTCEIDANPPPQYHWTIGGEKMLDITNNPSLIVTKINSSATYNCTATNYLGSKTKGIHVHVKSMGTRSAALTTPAASTPEDVCSPTLSPSELIVKFGDPASINCSISAPDFSKMGWKAPFGGSGFKIFIFGTWTTDNLDVWNPEPFCFVTLLNGHQCTARPSITVYKSPDWVVLHPLNAMVEGRQHKLHCDIINVAPVQNLTVRWYKNDAIIMTESFNKTIKTPVNESSTLLVNISRGDSGVLFRCEAQLDFDSKTLVTSDILNVSVHYAPELNNINTVDVLDVEEGSDVTLTCEIDANPPPQYHWTRDGEKMLDITNNPSLTITKINSSATYNCTATNYLGSKTKGIHVHVKIIATTSMTTPAASAPGDVTFCSPTLMPSELVVKFGNSVLINCSFSQDSSGIGWEAVIGGTGLSNGSFVTWEVAKLELWDPKPFCFVTMLNGRQCISAPFITVYKSPDRVVLHPVNAMVEGRQQRLHCDIINVAPVQNLTVRWYKNNVIIRTESFNKTIKAPVNESSTLLVNISRGDSGVLFRCEAQLDFDSNTLVTSDILNVSVHYAPELNINTDAVLDVEEGSDVTLTCEIHANPPSQYHWTRDGEKMLDITNDPSLTITKISSSATYHCTATNYLGSKTKGIHVHVKSIATTTTAMTTPAMTTPAASAPEDVTVCSPTLIPSELIVRFGDPASITCSISVPHFSSMGWRAQTRGTGFVEVPFATWTVDALGVWDPNPSCFVTLLNGHQCISTPSITVYKSPDKVVLHPVNAMVEGRQHELHCDIINVAPVQNLTVTWYKNDAIIMTESFNKTIKTPVNESSTLLVNISRADSGVLFRCEAQLDFDSNTLVTSDILNVSVHYAPELNINTDAVLDVEEGSDVTLTCEIDANPPPQYHWTRDGENVSENNLSLNISRVKVNVTYTCTATNYVGSKMLQFHVNVKKSIVTNSAALAPEDVIICSPTLMPSELVVRFGDPASINCSFSQDSSGIGWEAVISNGSFVTWEVDKLELWDPKPFCFVNLLDGRQCTSIPSITVYKTPDHVLVSSMSHKPMVEGTEYLLTCDIINIAPVQNITVKWYRGRNNVHTEMFNDNMESYSKTPNNLTSNLKVTSERGDNGMPFECRVEQHLGPKRTESVSTSSKRYVAVVHFAPTFLQGNYSREISLGENVTFGCQAEGNPVPEIHWNYTSAENVQENTWGRQKNITIEEATSTNAGHYICFATNEVGHITRVVTLMVKDEGDESRWWYIPLIIIVICIVILFIMLTVQKCLKQHGEYNFESVKTNEDIPLGNKSAAENA